MRHRWIAATVVVVLGVVFWVWSTQFEPRGAAAEFDAVQGASPAIDDESVSPHEPADGPRATRASNANDGSRLELANDPSTPNAEPSIVPATLRCVFRTPNERSLIVERVESTLNGTAFAERRATYEATDMIEWLEVPRVKVALTFEVPGYRAEQLEIDLHGTSESTVMLAVVLWPDASLPVIVRTRDGRPLRTLADDLGIEPKRLFVGAFDVLVQLDAPTRERPASHTAALGIFRPPPKYQQWELSHSSIGWVELTSPQPIWSTLTYWGVIAESVFVPAGAERIEFTLSPDTLEAAFAEIWLRVVDEAGVACSDARVTMRADTSAHRRKEHENVAPDSTGIARLTRLVPGLYELSIVRGEALHQERIELSRGEKRDHGRITLGSARGLDVRVIDEQGQGCAAWLEIAPLQPGKFVEELYPPMLHRTTDPTGFGRVPVPSQLSIMRARRMDVRSRLPTNEISANSIVDPAQLPQHTITLRLQTPLSVTFTVTTPGRVDILDEQELCVHSFDTNGRSKQLELLRGSYTARLRPTGGAAPIDTPFRVDQRSLAVLLP